MNSAPASQKIIDTAGRFCAFSGALAPDQRYSRHDVYLRRGVGAARASRRGYALVCQPFGRVVDWLDVIAGPSAAMALLTKNDFYAAKKCAPFVIKQEHGCRSGSCYIFLQLHALRL